VDILELRRYYNGQQAGSSVLRSIQAASSCLFQLAYALSREVFRVRGGGVHGRIPASGEFRSHGTVEDEAAEITACDNIKKNNNMDAVNRPSEPLSCCNYLQILATPIRLVPSDVDRCKTPCRVALFLDCGCRNTLDPLHAR
jgi:hypothetical protein